MSWFIRFMAGDDIKESDIFRKQTVRNHCLIDSPAGALKLTIPVAKGSEGMRLTRDVKISEHGDWRRKHWHALETAYFNSPFFEYMRDDFKEVFNMKTDSLWEFNEAMLKCCLGWMDGWEMMRTKNRETGYRVSEEMALEMVKQMPYYQVFGLKHGFLPDLSIVDLLFNMGPEALEVMMKTMTRTTTTTNNNNKKY